MSGRRFSLQTRLYVQLRPNVRTVQDLYHLRSDILGRRVAQTELHMTVIHIGELSRLATSLEKFSINNDTLIDAAEKLVDRLIGIRDRYKDETFDLEAIALEPYGKTAAVSYQASERLRALHAECLDALMDMLRRLGVNDPMAWMQADNNLRFALTLHPHIAIVKGANEFTPAHVRQNASLTLMDIVY